MSGFDALHDLQRIDAVHRREDLEIFRRQLGLEQPDIGENIVDDEDAGGHDGCFRKPSMVWRKLRTEIGLEI